MPNNPLSKYKDYLTFRKYEPETSYRYLRIVEDYLDFSPDELSRTKVMEYLSLFSDTSGSYRRFIMHVLKGLFEQCDVKWPFTSRELPKPNTPKQPYLKFDQAELLLKIAKESSKLDYALVCLDAVTGARRVELSNMLRDDYQPPSILIKTRKGGLERTRTLDPETCSAIDSYLQTRKDTSEFLFVSEVSNPLTPGALTTRFQSLARKCGFKKGTGWHSLRRGVVTWLYKNGMKEKEIQELIGWKTPNMVHKYIQLETSEVETKSLDYNPMFRRKEKKE